MIRTQNRGSRLIVYVCLSIALIALAYSKYSIFNYDLVPFEDYELTVEYSSDWSPIDKSVEDWKRVEIPYLLPSYHNYSKGYFRLTFELLEPSQSPLALKISRIRSAARVHTLSGQTFDFGTVGSSVDDIEVTQNGLIVELWELVYNNQTSVVVEVANYERAKMGLLNRPVLIYKHLSDESSILSNYLAVGLIGALFSIVIITLLFLEDPSDQRTAHLVILIAFLLIVREVALNQDLWHLVFDQNSYYLQATVDYLSPYIAIPLALFVITKAISNRSAVLMNFTKAANWIGLSYLVVSVFLAITTGYAVLDVLLPIVFVVLILFVVSSGIHARELWKEGDYYLSFFIGFLLFLIALSATHDVFVAMGVLFSPLLGGYTSIAVLLAVLATTVTRVNAQLSDSLGMLDAQQLQVEYSQSSLNRYRMDLEKTANQLRAEKERVSRFASLQVQEMESLKSSFAAEVHDHFGPLMYHSIVNLTNLQDSLKKKLSQDPLLANLILRTKKNMSDAYYGLRHWSAELVPSLYKEVSLKDYLEETLRSIPGTDIKFLCNSEAIEKLDNKAQLNIYRMLNEAVTNSLKYSGTNQVDVLITESLKPPHSVILTVSDKGIGCDLDNLDYGIGINSIEARAATLHGKARFKSEPRKGFTLLVQIPVEQNLQEETQDDIYDDL